MTLDAGKWRSEEEGIKKYLNKIRNIIIISSKQKANINLFNNNNFNFFGP